jgi:serine/threonine protein kinase
VPRSMTGYHIREDAEDLGLPSFSAPFPSQSSIQLMSASTYGHESSTIGDLKAATNEFAVGKVLGEGAFGKVFKGSHKGKDIGIKQMRLNLGGSADKEFRSKLEVISRVHHCNLIKLLGFVVDEDQRYLFMEYVPNGTLYSAIHPKSNGKPLSWEQRKKVAVGVARGLAYLHEDCFPRIIHRDLKSSNILLDSKFEAQVADFGLAKLDEFSVSHTHVSTRVMGTFGYLGPAYATRERLTEESDVYSFGVVLFELVSGRKAVDLTIWEAELRGMGTPSGREEDDIPAGRRSIGR